MRSLLSHPKDEKFCALFSMFFNITKSSVGRRMSSRFIRVDVFEKEIVMRNEKEKKRESCFRTRAIATRKKKKTKTQSSLFPLFISSRNFPWTTLMNLCRDRWNCRILLVTFAVYKEDSNICVPRSILRVSRYIIFLSYMTM